MPKVDGLNDVADLLEDDGYFVMDLESKGARHAGSLRHEIAAVLRGEDGAEDALTRRANQLLARRG